MAENFATNNTTDDAELVIQRTFNAPRELVFKVWTEAEHLVHWWGPKGFTFGVSRLDLRPGGVFHYSMTTPDGHVMWGKFVYQEIAAPEKLVFVNSFSDEEGNTVPNPMAPVWPIEIQNTITFTEQDGKTMIDMRGIPINATEEERQAFKAMHHMVQQGFAGTMGQLEEYLAKL